jgi:alpha-mannosidase
MRLSLLKSAEYPDTEADRGLHQFTYSLYSHTEPWHESDLIPLAWDLNDPLTALVGENLLPELVTISSRAETRAPRSTVCACAALDAVKKSEDGKDLIIRLHEMHGGRGRLKIEFAVPVSGWAETNLMEEARGKFKTGRIIKRKLHPFEIVTFRVKL